MNLKCGECGEDGALRVRENPEDLKGPVLDLCVTCWRHGRGVKFGVARERQPARLRQILDAVDLSAFPVGVRFEALACQNGCCTSVAVSLLVRDRDNPAVWTTISSKGSVSPDISARELHRQMVKAIKSGLDHELREQFVVDGERPFDPHTKSLMP